MLGTRKVCLNTCQAVNEDMLSTMGYAFSPLPPHPFFPPSPPSSCPAFLFPSIFFLPTSPNPLFCEFPKLFWSLWVGNKSPRWPVTMLPAGNPYTRLASLIKNMPPLAAGRLEYTAECPS